MKQEYSQPPILPFPHFRWVVNAINHKTLSVTFIYQYPAKPCGSFQKMGGQLRLLNIACAAKAKPRTVVLTRATREEILHFSVLGGLERNCGIFISKVEKGSKAHDAGLKRGDQVRPRLFNKQGLWRVIIRGFHRDWKPWKMKMVMEKSSNMNNWPKVMEFCE